MSFEKYAAIVSAVAEETRQSGSTLGNAYKTIFSRISRSKDGLTTDTEMADAEKAFNSVGVSVRGADGDLRDVSDTLDDLNKVWGTLNKSQKSYVAEAAAGVRQKNIFIATMDNYNKALQLERDALESSGTAMEINDKRADSIQGKMQKLSATMTEVYSDAIPEDAIKGMLDFAITIAEVADSLGLLQGAIAAIGVAGGAQVIGLLASNWAGLVAAITSPIGIASIAAGGIVMALKAISDAYENAEEANEKMQESFSNWQEAEQNVANIKAQLEETTAQYESLLAQGSWTPMEQVELDRLKEATEELRIQYELAQEKANREARAAAEDAVRAYNKNFKEDISEEATKEKQDYAEWSGNNAALIQDERDLSGQIAAIRQFTKLRDEAVKEYEAAKANDDKNGMEWWGEEVQRYNEMNQEIKDSALEQVDQLQEYRNILSQLPEEELAKVSGAKELLTLLDEQIAYAFSELAPEKWNKMKIDSVLDSDNLKEEAESLKEFAETADEAELSAENLRAKYPELAAALEESGVNLDDFISTLVDGSDATTEAGQAVEDTAETVASTAETLAESNKKLTDSISDVQSLLAGQSTGKSISLADFNAEGMEDYRSALEYVNGTMQFNAEKVNEIVKAKAEEEKATIAAAKAQDQNKYLENAGQIEKLREQLRSANNLTDEQRTSIEASISSLLAENSTLVDNCNQYNIMTAAINEATSAYQNWINAQSAAQSGDMFDSAVQAINHIDDTLNNKDSELYGRIGNEDYKAAIDFIIPESVDRTDQDAVNSYLNQISDYLTTDGNGNFNGLDIANFCQKAVDAGLMTLDESGESYVIAGQKTMQDFADGLGLSLPFVQAMFGEMEEFGAEFDWGDEAIQTLGDLGVVANEAAESLRGIEGNEDLKIVMDVSQFDDAQKACDTLDSTIAEMNNLKAQPGVDTSQVEQANLVIQYCVAQKQLLTAPVVMSVDTSGVTGELGNALSLLQEFQATQNTIEMQASVGADTSEAEGQLESLAGEIQGLSPDIKATLNIDTSSVDSIQSYIDGLDSEALVKMGVDSSLIDAYEPEDEDATVKYDTDTSKPDGYKPEDKSANVIYGCIHTAVDMYNPSNLTRTVTYNVVTNGTPPSGGHGVNGTAHAGGTANASGNWGTAAGGRTLVGELGQEIVVDPRTGMWYTVGDTGAEFVDIPKNAIIFNHKQSESLLKYGFVAGRGTAEAWGTAMVTGGIRVSQTNRLNNNQHSSSSTRTTSSGSSSRSTSGGTSSRTGVSSGGNEKTSETALKKFRDWISNVFDFAEIRLTRLNRLTEKWTTKAEEAVRYSYNQSASTSRIDRQYTNKASYTQKAIDATSNEIKGNEKAIATYNSMLSQIAKKGGLKASVTKQIRDDTLNGTFEIKTYKADSKTNMSEQDRNSALAQIEALRESILKTQATVADLQTDLNNIEVKKLENSMKRLKAVADNLQDVIDKKQAKGLSATASDYRALIANAQSQIANLRAQNEEMRRQMEDYSVGSEKYEELYDKIKSNESAIRNAEISQVDWNNAIANIPFDALDKLLAKLDAIAEYNASLIDLKAAQGNDLSLNDYLKKISDNEDKIAQVEIERANAYRAYLSALADPEGVYGGKTADEWLTAYNQFGAQINNLKVDIEGIRDEMRDDVYWRSFDRAHEACQRYASVVAGLRDMIDSDMYFDKDGSLTEYGITQVANLVSEYENAQKEVQNYSNDIKNLNDLYAKGYYTEEEYKNKLNELQTSLLDTASDMKSIMSEIKDMYKDMQEAELDNLFKIIDARNKALSAKKSYYDYDKSIKAKTKDIQVLEAQIAALEGVETAEAKAKRATLQAQLKQNQEDLNDTINEHMFELSQDSLDDMKDTLKEAFDDQWQEISMDLNKIAELMASANALTASSAATINGTLNELLRHFGVDPVSTGVLKGYARGTRRASKTQDAWVNELGTEMIVRPSDGAIMAGIKKGDGVVPADLTDNLFAWGEIDPAAFINNLIGKLNNRASTGQAGSTINQHYDSLLNVEGNVDSTVVTDLNKFAETFYKGAYNYTVKEIVKDAKKAGIKA